jgi:hypothetical protein
LILGLVDVFYLLKKKKRYICLPPFQKTSGDLAVGESGGSRKKM